MKLSIKNQPNNQELIIMPDQSILNLLQEKNIYISALCGGRGTCGKCKIKILKGELPVTSRDEEYFSKKELEQGYRLACSAFPENDLEIIIDALEEDFAIITGFQVEDRTIDNGFETRSIDIKDVDWQNIKSIDLAIQSKLDKPYQFSYKALKQLSFLQNTYIETTNEDDRQPLHLLIRDTMILDVFYKESFKIYGVAIDIGTTTLGFHLIDLENGQVIKTYASTNSQRIYSADVISRIQSAASGNLEALSSSIKKDILKAIEALLVTTGIDKRFVYSIAIAGNTTMLHLLLGLSTEALGQFPFTTTTLSLTEYPSYYVFENTYLDCNVTLLPGIDAYVGADIVAGILHHEMFNTDKVNMLIDLGTNGEIVIGNKDQLITTATAAGPALEGGNISCGTGSVAGAIASVKFNKVEGRFEYKVIGEQKPIGLCGSGIIDAIAEGLKHEWIDATGRLSESFTNGEIAICTDKNGISIKLTQKDIREIQLAKSALKSGIECLAKQYGVSYESINNVYLAGGFGSNIDLENAVRIGLIPKELMNKVIISGNTCLGGVTKYLLHKSCKNELERVLKITEAINLSNSQDFNDLFIKNMFY
ncbi:Uncharacterized 2Fe-2 and 4Fe-4S clusters-containing protein, contains DUF4445 domain [Natronincola peptidivorans]|uniref:Uncharacterized 2Fe-2 and 4Fe-4S clusters-containing protein, contains DUF4445 domain n=1 Tax=Natronincola peptidivorans TaxID=426128 RepID=A0A1I0HDH2_9FIRM|nr:ASKHA domain-containing protein [Natronincola peptidivorans]SET81802.1 Uncharacterized 2Fe-2 and 4Fe-4S clusters-containing protein, contains DUF4445 domain [Natronincola peptidivorans]